MDCPTPDHHKKIKRKCLKSCNKKCAVTRVRRKPKINVIAPRGIRGAAGPPGPVGLPGTQGPTGAPGIGLLTFYNFIEIPDPMLPGGPAITALTLPIAPATTGPELQVSNQFISLSGIDINSRIALTATIVWSFSFITDGLPQVAVGNQMMQFSIFRDAPLSGVRVGTVVDAGRITEINREATEAMLVSGTFTTTFECTDTGVPAAAANYFLTAAAGAATGFSAPNDSGPTIITSFSNPTIHEVHFGGKVILPNTV
ncbi:hypothetical protein [Paenibacillus sp. PL91]|uniref:hypothetical protein n=1 Tax=Paenibacillus sp. PL91 TaxID=2729538 RepID=UPI00145E03BB|nr:hypothetical protein [Paenibacillus sp. PL91]MBC9202999.1 hypothetical protein [Paenibacillus sp. PL91]